MQLQLWAEGLALWEETGVQWRAAEKLAREEHGAYRVRDTWEDALRIWGHEMTLDGRVPAVEGFKARDALVEGLGFQDKGIKKPEEMRVAKALKSAGFEQARTRREGQQVRLWFGVTTCDDLV